MNIHPSLEIIEIIEDNLSKIQLNTQTSSDFDKLLFEIIAHKKLTIIHGIDRIGKTTFLQQIQNYFSNIKNSPNIETYIVMTNFLQKSQLNIQDIFNTLREQQPTLHQVSNDELKGNLIQRKFKLILLLDQFEVVIIKQNIKEIKQILDTFTNEFASQIFLTIKTDFLEESDILNFNPQLIIKLLPLEYYQIKEYFAKIQVNYLEQIINQVLKFNKQNQIHEVDINYKDQLYYILLEGSEISQKLKKLCEQISNNDEDSQQLFLAIQNWVNEKPNLQNCMQLLNDFNLKIFSEVPGMLIALIQVCFQEVYQKIKYHFYQAFINTLVEQKKNQQPWLKQKFLENKTVTELELTAVEIRFAQQNLNRHTLWKNFLMKHQQLVDFLISQYFYKQVAKLEEEEIQDDQLLEIRDSSGIKQLDFSSDKSLEILNFLKNKFETNLQEYHKLIILIKGSAKIPNFELEAGNAMVVLSHMEATVANTKFLNIKIRNSSLNKIKFSNCNFNNSIMNNVNLQQAEFSTCVINAVQWNSVESNLINSLTSSKQTKFTAITNKQTKFTAINQVIVSSEKNFIIYQLNFQTEKYIKKFYQKSNILRTFSLPMSLKQIFACECKSKVVFWNMTNGKIFRNFKLENNRFEISSNFKLFVVQSSNEVTIFAAHNLTKLFSIRQNQVTQIIFSPDSNILGLKGLSMSFWKIKSGTQVKFGKVFGFIQEFEFSPDSKILALNLQNQYLFLWSLQEDKLLYKQQFQIMDSKFSIAFSPNQEILAIYNKQRISILRIEDWKYEDVVHSQLELNNQVTFTPNGQYFAFSRENCIFLWEIQERAIVQTFGIHSRNIESFEFSPDGKFLLSNCENNEQILIWKTDISNSHFFVPQLTQEPDRFKLKVRCYWMDGSKIIVK